MPSHPALALQHPWAIILGKTAALDALAPGPHGVSGLREHVKYLVALAWLLLASYLGPAPQKDMLLFTATLAALA